MVFLWGASAGLCAAAVSDGLLLYFDIKEAMNNLLMTAFAALFTRCCVGILKEVQSLVPKNITFLGIKMPKESMRQSFLALS